MTTLANRAIEVLHEILRTQDILLNAVGEHILQSRVYPLLEQEDPDQCGFLVRYNTEIEVWSPQFVCHPNLNDRYFLGLATIWKMERPVALYFLWDGTKWWNPSREGFLNYLMFTMREDSPFRFKQ